MIRIHHPSTILSMSPSLIPTKTRHVAVIGAGAAGLVAARELRREGHSVVVFEKSNKIGGTWIYTPQTEPDPLSLDPTRPIVHSSLYSSLRTNLPRECMGFRDFPFTARPGWSVDPRRYPSHQEVLVYLEEFEREFGIGELVRFDTEVVKVEETVESGKWRVRSKQKEGNFGEDDEIYDAVVVCSGHFTEPRVALDIPGINSWPGTQMHSHNYRVPDPFKDQVVVVVGYSSSAVDISRDIARVAKEVHIASRSFADETHEREPNYDNLWLHSMIKSACKDGSVVFRNGKVIFPDVVLHCTGFKYHFPFLETKGYVTIDDNRVGPLYKHVFPPALAPWLSFVGLAWKVCPFPMFEYQSKWIAGILSGRILLPTEEDMMEDITSFYSSLETAGVPKRYTHEMGDSQFEYNNWLAAQCGIPGFEEWRKHMYYAAGKNRKLQPNSYRDEWEDQDLILQAQEDLAQCTSNKDESNCVS